MKMEQKFWVVPPPCFITFDRQIHFPLLSTYLRKLISSYETFHLYNNVLMNDWPKSNWLKKQNETVNSPYISLPRRPIPFYIEKTKYPFPQIPILLSTAAKEDLYTYLPNTKTPVIIKTISNMTAKQAINTKIHGNSKWKNKHAS